MIFGTSRSEVKQLIDAYLCEVKDDANRANERAQKLVALFLASMSKKDLKKKLKQDKMAYGDIFPQNVFDSKGSATVEQILEHIDP